MVRDVCAAMPEARALFTEASMTLGLDVGALCWEGDSRLGLTAFTQPCLLTAELALYRALQARVGLSPEHFGGHSLGEYAALVAAGAIPFSSALRLVQRRGALMQSACPHGFGAMVAVIGDALPRDAVGTIATAHGLDIANDNSPAQLVLSGPGGAVEAACAALAADSVTSRLRVVRLAVSAPFHSRHMAPIEAAEMLPYWAMAYSMAWVETLTPV